MTHIAIFKLNVERSRALIGTHSQLHNKQGKPKTVVSDIMRAAVVMVVSAIDAYLHGLLSEHVERAAQLTPPPAALLELVKEWRLDAKETLPYLLNKKGPTEFRQRVVDHFSDRTLQDPSKVEQVGRVLGVEALWDEIATRLSRPAADVRRDFAAAVKRRHQIAHEADLDPSGKTQTKKRRLTKVEALGLVGQVETVGDQLQAIFESKYP
jgi:hypothetical protein